MLRKRRIALISNDSEWMRGESLNRRIRGCLKKDAIFQKEGNPSRICSFKIQTYRVQNGKTRYFGTNTNERNDLGLKSKSCNYSGTNSNRHNCSETKNIITENFIY